jgi:PIN domain nuclease of toxin-antitoxin system
MKILLDTHVFLWVVAHQNLSPGATSAFLDRQNELYLSAVSYWEICIKRSIGKLTLAPNWIDLFDDVMAMNGIHWLAVDKLACQRLLLLPYLHGDLFDRMLIAQAVTENMTLMSADEQLHQYPIAFLW